MTKGQAAERAVERDLGIIRDSKEVFGNKSSIFDRRVEEYRSISETIKSLEEEKKNIQSQLQRFFTDSGLKTIMVDGSRVTMVQNQGRSTIDKMKLLEHGVSAKVIAECTVQGSPFEYVKITAPKE